MTGLVKRGWMVRSVFDTIDGIDQLGEQLASVTVTLDKLAAIQPQLVALLPDEIASQQINRELALANYATMSGIYAQTAALIENAAAMDKPLTPPRTTTPSICRRRLLTTQISSAA